MCGDLNLTCGSARGLSERSAGFPYICGGFPKLGVAILGGVPILRTTVFQELTICKDRFGT